jgi:hypothetical protein
MGAGIAASPHCAERRICRCSRPVRLEPEGSCRSVFDPGSPAQASLPIEQLPRERSQPGLIDRVAQGLARHFRLTCLTEVKTVQLSTALLGMTIFASRFARPRPEGRFEPRRAKRKIISSGASYRLASGLLRKASQLPAGRRSDLWSPAARLAVAGFWRGWDRRPDHLTTMGRSTDSGKRIHLGLACG